MILKYTIWRFNFNFFPFGVLLFWVYYIGCKFYLVDLFIFRKLLKDITEPYLVPRETDLMKFLKNVINKWKIFKKRLMEKITNCYKCFLIFWSGITIIENIHMRTTFQLWVPTTYKTKHWKGRAMFSDSCLLTDPFYDSPYIKTTEELG